MADENVNGAEVQGEGNENGSVPEVELIIKVGHTKGRRHGVLGGGGDESVGSVRCAQPTPKIGSHRI